MTHPTLAGPTLAEPTLRRMAWLCTLGAALVCACAAPVHDLVHINTAAPGRDATHAVVIVNAEDPSLQVWRLVSRARVGDVSGTQTLPDQAPSRALGFPITYAVVANGRTGTLEVDLDALGRDGTVVGRARGSVELQEERGVDLPLVLGVPCDADVACSDGVFCNGEEACLDGVCRRGTPPCQAVQGSCAQVQCQEAMDACITAVRHELCATPGGPQRYCDVVLGCVVGTPCQDAAACSNGIQCDGQERCLAGRCVPGDPPMEDDTNPCTLDGCVEGEGVVHVPAPNGNTCEGGICVDGACQGSLCGDGILDTTRGEQCDRGGSNSNTEPDRCRLDCRQPRCGDGTTDSGEGCDLGALNADTAACLTDCTPNQCGDGLVLAGVEPCDDGNLDNQDDCLNTCRRAICGDGIRNVRVEECDDGNQDDDDGCRAFCVPNVCGDGVLNALAEACDDSNTQSGDGCQGDCLRAEVCGDGLLDPQEDCEDANDNPLDGCDRCRTTVWSVETVSSGLPRPGPAALADLYRPQHLAVASDGTLLVAEGRGLVLAQDAATHRMETVVRVSYGAAAGTGPALFLRGSSVDALVPVPGTPGAFLAAVSSATQDYGAAVYRVEGGVGRVVAGGSVLSASNPLLRRFQGVGGLALLPDGQLVLAEVVRESFEPYVESSCVHVLSATEVLGVDPSGAPVAPTACGGFPALRGAAADANGCLYLSDATHQVTRVPLGTCALPAGVVAGTAGVSGRTGDGGPAQLALLNNPRGLAVRPDGALLVADTGNHVVRVVLPDGTIRTLAGAAAGGWNGRGPAAASALMLWSPTSVALDAQGNTCVADVNNHRVVRVDAAEQATTVSGRGFPLGGEDPADLRRDRVSLVAVNAAGDVFAASEGRLVRHGVDGSVALWAGARGEQPDPPPADGQPALGLPLSMGTLRMDAQGRILFSDGPRIRRINADGRLHTVATVTAPGLVDGTMVPGDARGFVPTAEGTFTGVSGWVWRVDAAGTQTQLPGTHRVSTSCGEYDCYTYVEPFHSWVVERMGVSFASGDSAAGAWALRSLAADGSGTLLSAPWGGMSVDGPLSNATMAPYSAVSPGNVPNTWLMTQAGSVRVLDLSAQDPGQWDVRTLVQTPANGLPNAQTCLAQACRTAPFGYAAQDGQGRVVFVDTATGFGVQRWAPEGSLQRLSGPGTTELPEDGPLDGASLSCQQLERLQDGALLCRTGQALRRVDLAGGQVRTVLGRYGYGLGLALPLRPSAPPVRLEQMGVADLDSLVLHPTAPVAYVLFGNGRLGMLEGLDLGTEEWTLRALSDSATRTQLTGPLASVNFADGVSLALDDTGQVLLVTDTHAHRVRRVDLANPTGNDAVKVVAGTGTAGLSGEGGPAASAKLSSPSSCLFYPDGSFLVADTDNHQVRHVGLDGVIRRVLGIGAPLEGEDGPVVRQVPIREPTQLALDDQGNLFVASSDRIRVVSGGRAGSGQEVMRTILRRDTQPVFPGAALACLDMVTQGEDLWVSSACTNLLLRVTRSRSSPPP